MPTFFAYNGNEVIKMAKSKSGNVFMSRKDFEKLPYEHQQILMSYYRENYTADAIRQGMGFPNAGGSFYEKLKELNLPTNMIGKKLEKGSEIQNETTTVEVNEDDFQELMELVVEKNPKTSIEIDIHGIIGLNELQPVVALADQYGLDVDFKKKDSE